MMMYVSQGYRTAKMKPSEGKQTPFKELWEFPPQKAPEINEKSSLKEIDDYKANKIGYFIAGKLKNNTRNNSNLIEKELVTLDYDDLGNMLYTKFVNTIKEKLKGIRFILYPTIKNNLPDYGMRYRLVIDTNRSYNQKENGRLIVNLIEHIGLPCDPKSETYSQCMGLPYLNACSSEKLIVKQDGEPLEVEKWLYEPKRKENKLSFTTNYRNVGGKYTGVFLNKVIEGTAEGNRDVWLTSVIGTMLNQGVEAQNAYMMADVINQNFINPPLSDEQVNKIYLSILDKETRKRGVAI